MARGDWGAEGPRGRAIYEENESQRPARWGGSALEVARLGSVHFSDNNNAAATLISARCASQGLGSAHSPDVVVLSPTGHCGKSPPLAALLLQQLPVNDD